MVNSRIFHGSSSRGAAQPNVDKEGDGLRRRLYIACCPRTRLLGRAPGRLSKGKPARASRAGASESTNPRLTQYTPGSRKPQQNYREIFGLTGS